MDQREVSFRSDESAQSQDRERLQEDLQLAWERVAADLEWASTWSPGPFASEGDIKLLKWALGVK